MRPRPKPTAAQAITIKRKPSHIQQPAPPARVSWWIGLSREAHQEQARAQVFDGRYFVRWGDE